MSGKIHIVGAGLAGLSAALHAFARGRSVHLYEGATHAGGRCRSFYDDRLGRQIDNGNHLVLTGNTSVQAYLKLAGVPHALTAAKSAAFPFVDVADGARWTVHMNDGPIPWWPLFKGRRPSGVGLGDMVKAGRILNAKKDHTISDLVGARGYALTRFWEPMSFAVMNLPPGDASAQLMRATALEAWRDGRLARPMFAPKGLGPALIDPAVGMLEKQGFPIRFSHVLKDIEIAEGKVRTLRFASGERVTLEGEDTLILAVPPIRLNALYPPAGAPEEAASILNAHFVLADPLLAGQVPPIMGVVGGITQWIFPHGDVISLTVSAAEAVEGATRPHDELIPLLWAETCRALNLPEGTGFAAARIIREKRATFRQTPENVRRRPKQKTAIANLILAGDTVDTGLPATIEGAIRSGERAIALID